MRDREQAGENLKRLLREQGNMTQKAFSDTIGINTITVNRWIRGRMALSDYSAREIQKHFPEYSIDFLRGFTDCKNEQEQERRAWRKQSAQYDLVWEMALLRGFAVDQVDITADTRIGPVDPYSDEEGDYRQWIGKEGKSALLDLEEWQGFCDEVGDYVEMRLSHILRRCEK